MTKLRLAGLLLILGAAITLALHALEAPEELYRWLYNHLLSGLDVPKDPSDGTVTAVSDVSLFGGILELLAGIGCLVADRARARQT